MPKTNIKRKAKVKQGLRDLNQDRNDGIKKCFKAGKQTNRERWFSSWLRKNSGGGGGGKKNKDEEKNKKNNLVEINARTLSKKRQRQDQEASKKRRKTAKERYCDSGTSVQRSQQKILKAVNTAAKRSENPLADKLPNESLSDFQIRKAKEQRSIIAKEEYTGTKRHQKSRQSFDKKLMKKKTNIEKSKNKGYDSEEDEWNAAAGASRTRVVVFGERSDDAPRFQNLPYKGKGKAKKKRVITLLEEEDKEKKKDTNQMALLRARVVDAYRASRGHHVMGPGSKGYH